MQLVKVRKKIPKKLKIKIPKGFIKETGAAGLLLFFLCFLGRDCKRTLTIGRDISKEFYSNGFHSTESSLKRDSEAFSTQRNLSVNISTNRPPVPHSRVGWSLGSFCDWLAPTYAAIWHSRSISRYLIHF